MKIRQIKAEEIQVRVARNGYVKDKNYAWVQILLYKDARADQKILDETFGPQNWCREHSCIGSDIYCKIGINSACFNPAFEGKNIPETVFPDKDTIWIFKQDCGTEGAAGTEAEKSRASDSFKRSAFNWGIGRELYTVPKAMYINLLQSEYELDEYSKVKLKRVFFYVSHIAYDEKGNVKDLEIMDSDNHIRYLLKDKIVQRLPSIQ